MAGGRQIDQPRARLHQRCDAVDQHEMAEMIGPKLGLEPVGGLAERAGHHAGVGDDEVERFAGVDKRMAQTRTLSSDARSSSTSSRRPRFGRLHVRGRRFGLGQIARGADDWRHARRARGPSPRQGRLTRRSPGRACRQNHALEHLVSGGFRSKVCRRDGLLHGRHRVLLRCRWPGPVPVLATESCASAWIRRSARRPSARSSPTAPWPSRD